MSYSAWEEGIFKFLFSFIDFGQETKLLEVGKLGP